MLFLQLPVYCGPRRGRSRPVAGPPAPAELTLVAATLEKNRAWVRLRFDRAVDAAAFASAAVLVGVGLTETRYDGTRTATLSDAVTVQVPLAAGARWLGTGTRLTATAGTGLVADDDGGTWGGTDGLSLPFP